MPNAKSAATLVLSLAFALLACERYDSTVCLRHDDCEPCHLCVNGTCTHQAGCTLCGNGEIEPGETCDGDCPFGCDDQDACTVDTLTGSAADCDALCHYEPLQICDDTDGCCPPVCNRASDSDCENDLSAVDAALLVIIVGNIL